MFIINPDPYSTPSYRIGPFTTNDIGFNAKLPQNTSIEQYFSERFHKNFYSYTINGREAIHIALSNYDLDKDDIVTILTTSNNFYISSCVTREIEKYCRWNREIIPETKVIFVNHEFGYACPDMDKMVSLGIPIIEDCAHSFFSQDPNNKLGKYGDYTIFSFPKIFPIQIGGLLINNNQVSTVNSLIDAESLNYIKKVLSYYILNKNKLLQKRAVIYEYGVEKLSRLGFTERFAKDEYSVPSVLLLNNNGIVNDLPKLKEHLWKHGIHSSVFYGEDAFYIPSHQNLGKTDVDYFVAVVNDFIINQK